MIAAVDTANYEYCEQTIELKKTIELSYLEMAERLYRIKLNRMYLPAYESFGDFLQEIDLSEATASKMINIWVRFVIEYQIAPQLMADAGGWTIVAEILPFAVSKKAAENWLEEAKALRSRAKLRKSLKEAETGIDMRHCKHEHFETITFDKCLNCHETWRTYEEFEKAQ